MYRHLASGGLNQGTKYKIRDRCNYEHKQNIISQLMSNMAFVGNFLLYKKIIFNQHRSCRSKIEIMKKCLCQNTSI